MDQYTIYEILEHAKSDNRSANEVFKNIADLLVKEHNVPEEKAIEAARNLIGFYEGVLNMISKHAVEEEP